MECREAQSQLSAYLDGELTPEERGAVEEHLRTCERCTSELAVLRSTVGVVRALPKVDAPPGLADRISARLDEPAPAAKRRAWVRKLWPAAAAAGIAALVFFYSPKRPPGTPETIDRARLKSKTEENTADAPAVAAMRAAPAKEADMTPVPTAPAAEKLRRRIVEGEAPAAKADLSGAAPAKVERQDAAPVAGDDATVLAESEVRHALANALQLADKAPAGPAVAKAEILEDSRRDFKDLRASAELRRVDVGKKQAPAMERRAIARAEALEERPVGRMRQMKSKGEAKALESAAGTGGVADAVREPLPAKEAAAAPSPRKPAEPAAVELDVADVANARQAVLSAVRTEGATILAPKAERVADKAANEIRFRCSQKQLVLLFHTWRRGGLEPRYVSRDETAFYEGKAETEGSPRRKRSPGKPSTVKGAAASTAGPGRDAAEDKEAEHRLLDVVVRFRAVERRASEHDEK